MIRFLHSADWQIGMKAVHVGTAGDRVREARFEAARNVIALARDRGVDFVLLAGDTFEDNAVDRSLVERVVDVLASSPVPVLVLPGNHDPLVPGAIYESRAFTRASDRVRLLATTEPVTIGAATILPCPLRTKHGHADPTRAIAAEPRSGIRIGVAHGTLRVAGLEGDDDFPIDADAAERCGLDYLALGHWHSHFVAPGCDGAPRIAYSGTHEQTKFGEGASGNALVVTIREPGAPPEIEVVRTGVLEWRQVERQVSEAADVGRIMWDLEAIATPKRALVDATLRGTLPSADLRKLDETRRFLTERFLFVRFDASAVVPSPTDARWIDALPPGAVQGAARRLLAEAAESPVAREALTLLYAFANEREAR
ncbi:MAG: DNA repair exonuclease [Planctomycetes bacterium]|nr:DNA repair exonuclease [Planctomycetota bacterium]MBI3848391.1 DNA repair exonuclease [Planctomycetota bacterium]